MGKIIGSTDWSNEEIRNASVEVWCAHWVTKLIFNPGVEKIAWEGKNIAEFM